MPGEYPFYFDEIQSVSQLIEGQYGHGVLDNEEEISKDAVFYATFSTAPNAIGGSAVCAFRLREVSDAFAGIELLSYRFYLPSIYYIIATDDCKS